MNNNFLKLNEGKTEVRLLGISTHKERFQALLAYQIARSKTFLNLGAIRDSELTYMTHLKKLKKS